MSSAVLAGPALGRSLKTLPTGPIAGLNISIAEVRAVVRGLTFEKKRVFASSASESGACAKR
jgi:hypothetical protein